MGLLSLNLPVIGQSSATEDQKTRDALTAIQTLVNGNIDQANAPTFEAAFSTYKQISFGSAGLTTPASSQTFVMGAGASGSFNDALVGAAGTAKALFWFDPAAYTAGTRATKLRLRAVVTVNAVAPAANVAVALNQVTNIGGASGASPSISAVAAAVQAVTVTTPAVGVNQAVTADFNAPAASQYCFTVTPSAGFAAGSVVAVTAQLEMRQT